jgi:hypothetical protein
VVERDLGANRDFDRLVRAMTDERAAREIRLSPRFHTVIDRRMNVDGHGEVSSRFDFVA